MPDLAVIMVGMDQWDAFTRPALESIYKYEPTARVYVMDCGKTPYPRTDGVIRLHNSPSYAYAMNEGVRLAGVADWYLFLNNDILLKEPLHLERFTPDAIYGRRLLNEKGFTWLESWIVLIPAAVWKMVGEWDEGFALCGFEDADYCLRAAALGIETRPMELNIKHFWGKTRWGLPDYRKVRLENIAYLERKHGIRLGESPKVVHD